MGSHDDVAVVGQNKHGLSGDLIDPGQNTLRGGVHGLTAGNHGVAAKIPEHGGKAVAGADGQEAYGLFGGGYLVTAFSVFQFFLNGVQIISALGGLAGGQRVGLRAHILDLRQLQRAVFLGFRQGCTGNVGMDVDLEGLVILTDDQTVADAAEVSPQGHEVDVLPCLAHHIHGVEGEGDLLLRHGVEVGLFLVRLRLLLIFGDGLAAELCQHTLQDQQVALAACVYHAGLLQYRVHVRGLGQRVIALLDGGG